MKKEKNNFFVSVKIDTNFFNVSKMQWFFIIKYINIIMRFCTMKNETKQRKRKNDKF